MNDAFFQRFGKQNQSGTFGASAALSPQQNAPTPKPTQLPAQSAAEVQPQVTEAPAPVQAAAPQPDATENDPFFQRFKARTDSYDMGADAGTSPYNALPDSPLSLVDRARLGWVRTPEAQQKLLEGNFGKDNVEKLQSGSEVSFVVKDKGAWKQVDPDFAWSLNKVGQNIADLPGDVAQFAGQYGLKALGAGAGAAKGASVGAAAGPWGAAAGALVGAGMGAMGAEALDMTSRKVEASLTGNDHQFVSNPEDVQKQLMASFMFGAEQEVGGKALQFGGKASVAAFNKAVAAMSDTPAGQFLASKLLSGMSGLSDGLAKARVKAGNVMTKWDAQAMDDAVNGTGKLYEGMKSKVLDLFSTAESTLRNVGKEYDPIEKVAHQLDYQPLSAVQSTLKELENHGYIKDGKIVDYTTSEGLERQLSAGERGALKYFLKQAENIQGTVEQGGSVKYQEMKNVINSVGTMLRRQKFVEDGNLKRLLKGFETGMKTEVDTVLNAADENVAQQYAQLNKKYGPLKDMVEEFSSKVDDDKVDSFVKKLLKQDGTRNSDFISEVSNALSKNGVNVVDPTEEILQMEAARQSTTIFGKGKLGFLRSPYMATRAQTALSGAKAEAKQVLSSAVDTIPYMHEALSMMKGVDAATRKQLLSNPEAIDLISKTVSTAHIGEKQMKEQLLQQSGVK